MKRSNICFILGGLFLLFSCGNFDDLNTNRDDPTKANSALLATGAIMGIVKPATAATFVDNQFLPKYMGWGEGERSGQYNSFGRESFDGYIYLKDYELMAQIADEQDKNAYEALALFLKTYRLYNYTISVGDIPYFDILKGKEGVLAPKYDTQKDIFPALLDNLDRAYELFMKARNFAGDPILMGNVQKWAKVVTALELRMLINLSKKDSDPDLKVKQRFKEVYQRDALMTSNSDNLQVVFSNKDRQIYPFNATQNKHAYYPMLSSTLIDILKKHLDYRLFYYASPCEAELKRGKTADDWNAYPGIDVSEPVADIKAKYAIDEYCGLNKRYVEYIAGEPYIIIGYGEQNFILAEAALRGWITEDPSVFYKKAIKASFDFISTYTPDNIIYHYGRKITDEYIKNFLNQESIQLSGDFNSNLKMLMEQKYVAAFMQLAWQPYYDYRRTGYPILPINPETNKNIKEPGKMPVRWLYPSKEFDYNKANVEEALKRQYGGLDEINEVMWILK